MHLLILFILLEHFYSILKFKFFYLDFSIAHAGSILFFNDLCFSFEIHDDFCVEELFYISMHFFGWI